MIRSSAEVAAVATESRFQQKCWSGSVFVGLMQNVASASAVKNALALQTDVDKLRVDGREVYWLARNNFADATISGAAIEKRRRR